MGKEDIEEIFLLSSQLTVSLVLKSLNIGAFVEQKILNRHVVKFYSVTHQFNVQCLTKLLSLGFVFFSSSTLCLCYVTVQRCMSDDSF